jgi:hypothetical protein
MLASKYLVRTVLLPLALIATLHFIEPTASGQVIGTYQAENQPRETGRTFRDRADGNVVVLAEPFLDGEGYMGFGPWLSNLPPNRNLTAWFRIAKVGVRHSPSVRLEVYDLTTNRILSSRTLNIDAHSGYLDHHLDFRVERGHTIGFLVYYFGTSQVKYDRLTIEHDN